MLISVICPVYNEEKYINELLSFLERTAPFEKEVILVDGGSKDKTKEIIKSWMSKNPNIKLLDNPDKYVPYALNKAIKESTGEYIIRLDAHAIYSDDYFVKIIETFNTVETDITGGPCLIAHHNDFQKTVGRCISHPFGTGDSKYHDANFIGYTDSVTFGAWKKEIFNDVGYFDERLIRNQDDEFHYRAKSLGKKLYLNPDIKLWYYPRDKFSKLFSQYFQYGIFKPLVLHKVKSEIKLRHIIPSIFSLYIISLPFLYFTFLWLIPLLLYIILDLIISIKINNSLKTILLSLMVFPTIHLAYGTGFIFGLFRLRKFLKK